MLNARKEVEMVILFGSYARGEHVEDTYGENGVLYEYQSDHDLLVVTRHDDLHVNFKMETKVNEILRDTGLVKTPISFVFHSAKHLNQALQRGTHCGRSLAEAQEYFDQWFRSANEFLIDYNHAFSRNSLHKAAFELHQANERFGTTILLVYTDYRPKEHDLGRLYLWVKNCDPRFGVFPQGSEEEKRLFELLRRAYVDARYKMEEYSISREELEYLAEKVEGLKGVTERLCGEKIGDIGRD